MAQLGLPAQVLGDRSLKLKYLNPNTMFLATGSSPTQPGKAHITAHIFDTITGRLLFSQTHEVTPSGFRSSSRKSSSSPQGPYRCTRQSQQIACLVIRAILGQVAFSGKLCDPELLIRSDDVGRHPG